MKYPPLPEEPPPPAAPQQSSLTPLVLVLIVLAGVLLVASVAESRPTVSAVRQQLEQAPAPVVGPTAPSYPVSGPYPSPTPPDVPVGALTSSSSPTPPTPPTPAAAATPPPPIGRVIVPPAKVIPLQPVAAAPVVAPVVGVGVGGSRSADQVGSYPAISPASIGAPTPGTTISPTPAPVDPTPTPTPSPRPTPTPSPIPTATPQPVPSPSQTPKSRGHKRGVADRTRKAGSAAPGASQGSTGR